MSSTAKRKSPCWPTVACSRIGTESKRQSQSGRRCRAASHSPPAAGAPPSRVPGGRAGRGACATQRRLAAASATEAATPGGRTGHGSRATPYVPAGEPPILMAGLVCPRQSPWSASGGVFARKTIRRRNPKRWLESSLICWIVWACWAHGPR